MDNYLTPLQMTIELKTMDKYKTIIKYLYRNNIVYVYSKIWLFIQIFKKFEGVQRLTQLRHLGFTKVLLFATIYL